MRLYKLRFRLDILEEELDGDEVRFIPTDKKLVYDIVTVDPEELGGGEWERIVRLATGRLVDALRKGKP